MNIIIFLNFLNNNIISTNRLFKLGANFLLAVSAILLWSQSGYSQNINSTSLEEENAPFEFAKSVYHEQIGSFARLYNGSIYLERYPGVKGHQYYLSDYWVQGSISYLGLTYDSVLLKYDILNDKVIVENSDEIGRSVGIELNKDNIDWFRLEESIFINMPDTSGYLGVYELAYSGYSNLFIKRKKIIGQALDLTGKYKSFYPNDDFLLQAKNQFFKISKANSIAKVYPEYKDLIKKFQRSLKIEFRQDKEKYLIEMIKYCDSLNN